MFQNRMHQMSRLKEENEIFIFEFYFYFQLTIQKDVDDIKEMSTDADDGPTAKYFSNKFKQMFDGCTSLQNKNDGRF